MDKRDNLLYFQEIHLNYYLQPHRSLTIGFVIEAVPIIQFTFRHIYKSNKVWAAKIDGYFINPDGFYNRMSFLSIFRPCLIT